MPKRVLIMLGGIAAAGMAVGPQARAQDPRDEQEVSCLRNQGDRHSARRQLHRSSSPSSRSHTVTSVRTP
jgi:hypothetical protein